MDTIPPGLLDLQDRTHDQGFRVHDGPGEARR